MIYNFIRLWEPIKAVINSSNLKAFKNKHIILTDIEISWLKNLLTILSIFVKTTTKLQAEKYPTIYYIIPEVFLIYNKLDKLKEELQVRIIIIIIIINFYF